MILNWFIHFSFSVKTKNCSFFWILWWAKREKNVIVCWKVCAFCTSLFDFLSQNHHHLKVWSLKNFLEFISCFLNKNWLLWNILKKWLVNCIYQPSREISATSLKITIVPLNNLCQRFNLLYVFLWRYDEHNIIYAWSYNDKEFAKKFWATFVAQMLRNTGICKISHFVLRYFGE